MLNDAETCSMWEDSELLLKRWNLQELHTGCD